MRFFKFVLGRPGRPRVMMFASILVGVVSGAASVGLLALINESLEAAGEPRIGRFALGFVGLCVLVTVARVGSVALLSILGQDLVKDLRLTMSRQVITTPLERLEDLGAHRLLATLTDDVGTLAQALVLVPVLCINGTIVIGSLGYLAWLDLRLFGILLIVVVLGIASYQIPSRLGMRKFWRAREEQDELFNHFRSLTEGVKELKLHRGRHRSFLGFLETTADQLRDLRVAASIIFGAAGAWGHLLFFVVIGTLLYARADWVRIEGDTLVAYTIVLLYMMTPMQMFLENVPTLGRADIATAKVAKLGFSLSEADETRGAREEELEAVVPRNRLELEGVSYTYRGQGDREFTLGPIDFELHSGEVVFLVGGNGSGKTTLAKILVGLYWPEQGAIRWNGERIPRERIDDYRQLFSVVFGDFYLFERLLGLEAPELDEKARGYLRDLKIDHKVEIEDGRLSTTDLSQGQRKRLALLTAYLEDRPVYLFDEWAADQDPIFKEIFYKEILAALRRRGKAVVVISHDDRYYHLADRIIKLEEGRLDLAPERSAADVARELMADSV